MRQDCKGDLPGSAFVAPDTPTDYVANRSKNRLTELLGGKTFSSALIGTDDCFAGPNLPEGLKIAEDLIGNRFPVPLYLRCSYLECF